MAWYTICKEIRKNERKVFICVKSPRIEDRIVSIAHCTFALLCGKAGCPTEFVVKVVVDLWVVTLF